MRGTMGTARWALGMLALLGGLGWSLEARADCDCGSTDASAPCTGTEFSRSRFGVEFRFEFECGGEACACGVFATGDPWVAARTASGEAVEAVTIVAVTPEGEAHGMMSNPSETEYQGTLSGYENYRAELNLMTQLPYAAQGGESLLKLARRANPAECGATAIREHGCAEMYEVLTVLAEVPSAAGASSLRPPFAGTAKPLVDVERLRFERLPSLAEIGEVSPDTFAEIRDRWTVPHLANYHQCAACSSEQHRAHAPHAAMDDYGAGRARQYLDDVMATFGAQALEAEKRAAVLALVQRGVDVWGAWRAGVRFGSGAGQHPGYKPALSFFAALYEDRELLHDVRAIAADPAAVGVFQEDTQLYRGREGVVLWGDGQPFCGTGATADSVRQYFNGYRGEWTARHQGSEGYDNQGSSCDPYGYIDGPGGGPDPTNDRGRSYQVVASGPLLGYAFAQHLMPWYRYAAGDDEVIEYADRYYRGRGVEGFSGGFWAAPDPCAPHDPAEADGCDPWRGGAGCTHYGQTWGPQADDPSECVRHDGDPQTDGRWSELHGFVAGVGGYFPQRARALWDTLRDCADPAHASYPCSGLGPVPTPEEVGGDADGGAPDPVDAGASTRDGGVDAGTSGDRPDASTGSGSPDAGPTHEADAATGGSTDTAESSDDGCGCRAAGSQGRGAAGWMTLAALAALVTTRRRTRPDQVGLG